MRALLALVLLGALAAPAAAEARISAASERVEAGTSLDGHVAGGPPGEVVAVRFLEDGGATRTVVAALALDGAGRAAFTWDVPEDLDGRSGRLAVLQDGQVLAALPVVVGGPVPAVEHVPSTAPVGALAAAAVLLLGGVAGLTFFAWRRVRAEAGI